MAEQTVVQQNIHFLLDSINKAATQSGRGGAPRLVAVSKTKPTELILECYAVGQRHFGENYLQELEAKSADLSHLPDIKWHYIGQIQSNKIPKICNIPNLYCVETLDCEKHAALLEKEMAKKAQSLLVNTSGEPQKGGIDPNNVNKFCTYLQENCAHLKMSGFMTIGSLDGSSQTPNPDFTKLVQVRDQYAAYAKVSPDSLDLSMGMSDDYYTAILQGSTSVRVGSKIFGPRLYKH